MVDYLTFLKTAAVKGKLAHAYLLSGNDTQGKEQLLQELLSYLIGSQKTSIHADVTWVLPETNEITIGQIRTLKEQLSLSRWVSPLKIGIIRSADRMNQEAQSALLKLLEEPKGEVLLLLEAQHASLLFDTIRSRAQELRFYEFEQPRNVKSNLLSKLQAASLAERFDFAAQKSQDPAALQVILQSLQREARLQFLQELKKNGAASPRVLLVFKEVLAALRQTQVSLRYATERILLEL